MNINESAKLQKESTQRRFQPVLVKIVNPAQPGRKPTQTQAKPQARTSQPPGKHRPG